MDTVKDTMLNETLKQFAERMTGETKKANRKTGASIYQVTGDEFAKYTTLDLAKWFINNVSDGALRYYLEQQTTGAIINEIKYSKQ